MIGTFLSSESGLSSGGTIDGDLTISGDLTVQGEGTTLSYDEIIEGTVYIEGGTSAGQLFIDGGNNTWQQVVFKSAGSTVGEIRQYHQTRMELTTHAGEFRFIKSSTAF